MHVKESIRAAVSDLLSGIFPAKVIDGPEHPLTLASMPGCTVYQGGIRRVGGTLTATEYETEVVVEVYRPGQECDSLFAADASAIEAAIYGTRSSGRFFDGDCSNAVAGPSSTRYVPGAFVKHSVCRMVWLFEYQTVDGNAETAV